MSRLRKHILEDFGASPEVEQKHFRMKQASRSAETKKSQLTKEIKKAQGKSKRIISKQITQLGYVHLSCLI